MSEDISSKKTEGIKKPGKRNRRRGGLFNLILLIAIIVVIGLFVWAEQQRRSAESQLRQTVTELEQLRESSERSGQEVAQRVLESLRKHIDLPTDPEPTVATIVDIAALREANEFYQPAENGDHLIITERRAILYDPDRDVILDVVPVRLDQTNPEDVVGEEGSGTTPSPTADGTTSPTPTSTGEADGSGSGTGTTGGTGTGQ